MKSENHQTSPNVNFINTERGKTKPNALEVPSISLPKGGGAIKGIDEKYSVNAVNGTSSFSIPLPFSPARVASPALSLSYSSGAGNGIFGLGWNLSLASIRRKTDKGLPQYFDAIDSDTFLFSEAEDLVPEFKKNEVGTFVQDFGGEYIIHEKNHSGFIIRYYKPRIEGLFARIERWTDEETGKIKWRVITKDNTTTLFGWTDNSIISNPDKPQQIFEWLPEYVYDDKGNCSQYIYVKENESGIDALAIHNKNRIKGSSITYTNTYLQKILYGNKTNFKGLEASFPPEADYLFSTVFDFGEYSSDSPYDLCKDWDYRPDAFSDYKAGFEIRTTRLCRRVMLFHHFNGVGEYDGLVKSVDFDYDTAAEQDFTFLKSITICGYLKKDNGSYSVKKLPPMEFEYQKHEWNSEVKNIASENLVHAPVGLDEQQYQFTDLFTEGLSGILTEQATGWYYKHNLGEGKFEKAKLVSPKPTFTGLGGVLQIADLDADGGKQVVSYFTEPRGFFELDDDNEWQRFKNFQTLPNIDFSDPNTRMLDLNGDGKSELVISEDNVFTWYPSEGRNGYSKAQRTYKPIDEEEGPNIIFADRKQTIYLADMSGNGMTDIVRIRNGEVCYWPNLGYGKFGAKVAMDNAPVFDSPDSFNPSFLKLADIDGSGTTDIIYLGKNKFSCWKNLSGNRFAIEPFEIDAIPEIHSHSKITVTDLLGNGVACIVWSGNLPKDSGSPLRYIDLMNSKKPHIMVSYKNNLGKEVSLEYAPSTKYYIDDKLAGNPWITKLHFPVHCVSKTTTEDKISGYKFVTEYKYHHGYYDHAEREFRGFGMVEQTDAESFEQWKAGASSNIVEEPLHQEPVVSKQWFHTGAFLRKDKILAQFEQDYWYNVRERAGFPIAELQEKSLTDARLIASPGLDADILDNLTVQEWREAVRACKGMALRSEVFARDAVKNGDTEDAKKKELTPYTVATHNCVIELLQPKGKNKHAVFVVKESEAITYNYERNEIDPRIAHNLNIKLDEYGNVLESAAVVYGRVAPDPALSLASQTQEAADCQGKTTIIYTHNQFTNDVSDENAHRLRLPSETKSFELRGVEKTGSYYSIADFENILSTSQEVSYMEIDRNPSPGIPERRLLEHVRTTYYNKDLTNALALHQLGALGLPYESYQLAYTPELLVDIFDTRVDDTLMQEGKFTHSEGDSNWWIRSGTIQYVKEGETVTDAQQRFFMPVSYTDSFGGITKVEYYGDYCLFISETTDVLGNKPGVEKFNFRTLSPQKMRDINGNFSEAISDELGLIKAMAVMGKGDEADTLEGITEWTDEVEQTLISEFFDAPETPEGVADSDQITRIATQLMGKATIRFVYDFETYRTNGKPVSVASIAREEHYKVNPDSLLQLAIEYSNGLGEVIMKKVQAEPGEACTMDALGNKMKVDTGAYLRWIGNGRTIKNNKGNPVKQYEPYFSVTPKFEDEEELVNCGVTPILYYDEIGRVVKTEMPDGTFTKVEFDNWKQTVYDANDTVKESAWYEERMTGDLSTGSKENEAAQKAAHHADTPNILYLDSLGRPCLSVETYKVKSEDTSEYYYTLASLDAEGNLRSVTDARGNTVMQYKYDMLGNLVYQKSMDAGQRWLLTNILSKPLRTWDERNHEFQYFYDRAQRPTVSMVLGGDGYVPLEHVFDRVIYGESLLTDIRTETDRLNEADLQNRNLLGQVIAHYDTGGLIETPEYDFKGQPISTTRKLFSKYKEVANWTDANLVSDLETETFTFITETDALGRIKKQTAPDGSVIEPHFNRTGTLDSESVLHPGTTASTVYIKNITYNEKGQRTKIIYGNDVFTKYDYDANTFRLKSLKTRRLNGENLQELFYTYDPVGNITHIEDHAIATVFYNNMIIEPANTYTYDSLYRLIEATGRENAAALTFSGEDNWNDNAFRQGAMPGDPMVYRKYTQKYEYDPVGNILKMQQTGAGNKWTRYYDYESENNRLKSTTVGDQTFLYPHQEKHGYITEMPHLQEMVWNFKEELVKTIQQRVANGGTPETTYYQYDGSGQRIRKITENYADAGSKPTLKEERIYIAGYELYKNHSSYPGLERVSLSLMDGHHRFVMIESRNKVDDDTEKQLTRYQLHNHLGSANLELNETGEVISYEEYHPFGTTAYQLMNKTIKAAAKRYRYTSMERDKETGLEYHSARYYLPWLGRWLSSDPIGIGDGVNVYLYVYNNPMSHLDLNGKQTGYKMYLNRQLSTSEGAESVSEQNQRLILDTILYMYSIQDQLKRTGSLLAMDVALRDIYKTAALSHSQEAQRAIQSLTNANSYEAAHISYTISQYRNILRAATQEQLTPVGMIMSKLLEKDRGWQQTVAKYGDPFDMSLSAEERLVIADTIAAKSGSSSQLANAFQAFGKALTLLNIALYSYQIGTGIVTIQEGEVGLGIIDIGEGTSNVGLTIGTYYAVREGLLVVKAGTGITTAATGIVAAGSLALAFEESRRSIKGEKTMAAEAVDYYISYIEEGEGIGGRSGLSMQVVGYTGGSLASLVATGQGY